MKLTLNHVHVIFSMSPERLLGPGSFTKDRKTKARWRGIFKDLVELGWARYTHGQSYEEDGILAGKGYVLTPDGVEAQRSLDQPPVALSSWWRRWHCRHVFTWEAETNVGTAAWDYATFELSHCPKCGKRRRS